MFNTRKISMIAALSTLAIAARALPAEYRITSFTIDNGGGVSAGGTYVLHGTIGQPEGAGPHLGESYRLAGGFWPGVLVPAAVGDCDGDGDLDLDDFACFADCLSGPGTGPLPDCDTFDADADGDVDLYDWAELSLSY